MGTEQGASDWLADNAWGRLPDANRQHELEDLFVLQHAWVQSTPESRNIGKSIFKGEELTGADVYFLSALALALDGDDREKALAQLLRARDNLVVRPLLNLAELHLEWANLSGAYLHQAVLNYAHLESTALAMVHLEGASLVCAHLESALLPWAHLEGANLGGAYLIEANLEGAYLEEAHFEWARLEKATVLSARLAGARLFQAHLEDAALGNASLAGKAYSSDDGDYKRTRHWVQDFPLSLPPTDLRGAFFDRGTRLENITLGLLDADSGHGFARVADVRWGDANLAVVTWTQTTQGFLRLPKRDEAIELGDEREANRANDNAGKPKDQATRLQDYKAAVRANRQLATALRQQGLNEDADRFAYKAQKLQREVLRRQGQWLRWFGSLVLDVIAGYGYRPLRAFGAYAFVITLFTGLYLLNSHFATPHLTWNEALVLSMSSFHGRGFFNPNIQLGDTYAQLAAIEALAGLLIEITFIATFTQRFFAR